MSSTGVILLGDTDIRKEQEYMVHFGLLSATGTTQDANAQATATAAGQERQRLNPTAPPSVFGSGSILSTERWSPLLNDAMILAGVENQLDFSYVLTPYEKEIFSAIKAYANTRNQNLSLEDQ